MIRRRRLVSHMRDLWRPERASLPTPVTAPDIPVQVYPRPRCARPVPKRSRAFLRAPRATR
jgi:hypothetical protein